MLVFVSLAISLAGAIASLPFWKTTILTATTFWPINEDDVRSFRFRYC